MILVQIIPEYYRLHFQQNYIIECRNDLLQPGIPAEDIHSVTDVGCAQESGSKTFPSPELCLPLPTESREYITGLTSVRRCFPRRPRGGKIKYHIVNILDPIPEEFRERFDLVRVQVLVLAIKTVDLGTALRNIESLIIKTGSCFVTTCLSFVQSQADISIG